MLKNKKIALYISGGIAAYKMANFARSLIKKGAEVRVAMTDAAQAFITPLTLQVLTKHEVMIDVLTENDPQSVAHIEFAQWGDYSILAPATANSIGKLANGIADNFVSTALLATSQPIFVVPAMNDRMYEHPANQRNLDQLRADGHFVMEPDTGFLAEGYEAKGRLPGDEALIESLSHWIRSQENLPLSGRRILVSSGGTVERIDPVRYISNDSSGRMGNAVAQAAYELGAEVTLVTTSALPVNPYIERVQVESAEEMYQALNHKFEDCQALIMSAAVSDFTPAQSADQKIKKESSEDTLTLHLKQNRDILKTLGQKKQEQILVGFAAETEHLEEYAGRKLVEKNLDMIVANDVSKPGAGFNVDTNEVVMIKKSGSRTAVPQTSKEAIGKLIMTEVIKMLEEAEKND